MDKCNKCCIVRALCQGMKSAKFAVCAINSCKTQQPKPSPRLLLIIRFAVKGAHTFFLHSLMHQRAFFAVCLILLRAWV